MQKRLLALVATVAVVLSMFAGIAFAAEAKVETIAIDSAKIEGNVLSGQVTVAFTEGDTTDQTANLTFKLGADTVTPEEVATTDNKVYTFKYTAVTEYAAGSYTLTVSHAQVDPVVVDATKAITVAPYVELDKTEIGQSDSPETIKATTNIDGATIHCPALGITADGSGNLAIPAGTPAGTYVVTAVKDALSAQAELKVNPFAVTITPNVFVQKAGIIQVNGTLSSNTHADGATVTVSGLTVAPITLATGNTSFSFIIPGDTDAGTYTVTATTAKHTASASFAITEANDYSMSLATTKIIASGSSAEFQPVIGSITREGTEADYFKHFIVKASYQSAANSLTKVPLQDVKATNGQFSFFIPTNIPIQDIELKVYGATVNSVTGAWTEGREITEIAAADRTIQVRYNVSPSTLQFPYTGTQSPVAITGKVTDSKGNPVEAATVTLNAPGAAPVSQTTTKTGEFGFVVLEWKQVGNISLTVKEESAAVAEPFVHVKGKVTPKVASLSVTPKSAVHSLVPIKFEVEGAGFPTTGDIEVKLYKGTTPVAVQNLLVNRGTDLTTFEASFNWKPASAGTYTVKASCSNHGAEATITVSNPLSYNFINSELLTDLPVNAGHTIKIGADDGVYLLTYDGKTTAFNYVYDVYVDGVLKVEKEASKTIKVPTTKLGTKSFRVIAYTPEVKEGKTVYTKVYEQTFVGQISGWDVTMEPAELTVNKAENISLVIKDKDGVPVNNATIKIDDKVYSSPTTYNAQDGTYVLKDVKFSTVAVREVKVYQGADVRATLKLDVVGEKVYNVTADVDTLLQGKAQDVKLTVTRDGKAVIPQRIKVVEKKLDPKELSFTPAADGVVKVNVKAVKAGELIVRAENYDGTLCGEVTINVVAPKLVLIDEEAVNATDNFKTDVHFKVVDPRDDSVIKSNLYLEGAYLTDLVIYNEHGGTIVNDKGVFTILGAEEHKLTILAKDGLYDDAEEDEEDVLVGLRVGAADGALVDGAFLVKEATIESNPAMIIVGAQNNLTLTYKDANGNAIVGKAVKAGEASLGKTDDNGQVVFPVGMPTGSVKVTGATDVKDVVVEHTIKIGYDVEAPKVTYEVDGDKATLIVTDNVRLVRVQINGKDIDFWPGAKYEQEVTLKPGVNKFAVKAQDSNDLVLDEVVEIEYVTDSTVLEGEQVKRQGEFVFVQLRQFEELGAQVGWKAETKTATFIVGETKVEVTIGSQTAKVNGEAVQMPAAPFIANDRTYVPTRFIAEQLGWDVHWAAGDVITITLP